MQVKSNHSINNIFDVDNNIEDITYNNQTYSNGFDINQLKSRNNKKIYYIKKRIKHNNSITNKNNLTQIEPHNILSPSQIIDQDSDTIPQQFKIETMPLDFNKFKSKEKKEIEKRNSLKIGTNQIYIRKKNVNNFLSNKANKKLSSSTIDEINISLKKLKIKPFKPKNNINMISLKRNEYGSYKLVKSLNFFNNTDSSNNNSINNSNNTINPYINRNVFQETDNFKNNKYFDNLDIQNESRFSYISNSHNSKIIFLQKLIYQQKNNLKSLREQNKNLLDKIKKLQESKSSLDIKTNIKKDMKPKDKDDKNKNNEKNKNDMKLNSKNETKDKFISIQEIKNDLMKNEENINEVKIIYCLYDKNNLLSYDFTNNEFKLKPIDNKDFQNSYNKDINTLLLYNNISNKLYIITGTNNDHFFIYDLNKGSFQKYSNLKNNHMFGGLLNLKKNIICLSGKFNKKVEIYDESNDKWNDKSFEELPEERAHSYYLLLNNQYIYGFYGYNYVINEYLNNIVLYDLDKNIWNTIMDNSLDNNNKGIKNHFCYQNINDKFINILGGDSNYSIITIDLEKKLIIKVDEDKDDKNNEIFLINNNYGYNFKNDSITLFDQNYNVHIINDSSNQYEIIKYIDKNLLNIDNI